ARMAVEHGIDLLRIPGTGIDGRVTKKDAENYLAARGTAGAAVPAAPPVSTPPPAVQPAVGEGDQVIPFTPIRKRIAEHMVMSKRTSPHVHTFAEVDMHRIAALREGMKKEGVSLTYMPFVIFATVRALKEFPIMNASVAGETTIIRKAIHVGVAVDTDRGLIVPVIRDADKKSLLELGKAVEDFAARAKTHKIMPDELAGGTFSITNPGPKGNLFGTPIIHQPQVGILRIGQIVKRPVVAQADGEEAIVIRPMMYLTLGYDHRIIDGVAGNGFLFRVREFLEAGDIAH
ncbi:MAG: Dihydrolipoamide acetyltransferase component of pyruvate dehydrogenase complex, partial [Actinobacteria bacterium]|nr:Dihydrolipoamide acetyltransferase component of pyruvate dehydrogenase complex [Actinomycetota bacterium]